MATKQQILTKIIKYLRTFDNEARMQIIASALVHELNIQFGPGAIKQFKRLSLNIQKQLTAIILTEG